MTTRTNYEMKLVDGVIPERCANPTRRLKDGSIIPLPDLFLYCEGCGRRKPVSPSCGRRNCRRCGLKRALKLERKYVDHIIKKKNEKGSMWVFVNLTGVRVSFTKENLRAQIDSFTDCAQKFLAKEFEEGGLYVTEYTTSYITERVVDIESAGDFVVQWGSYVDEVEFVGPATVITYEPFLYLHGHSLCFGRFKDKAMFEERWGRALMKAGFLTEMEFRNERDNAIDKHPGGGYERVEGLRYVGIEAVRSPRGSVRYILKYVAKGVDLSDDYLDALYRLKHVRSWGCLYGVKEPSYDLICGDCGGNCKIAFYEEQCRGEFDTDYGPLTVKRVLREFPGPPR